MPGGGWQGAPPPQTGFQRHHLIPIALDRRPQMAAMFGALRAARRTAVMRLRLLQDRMRRALTDGRPGGFWLDRRDPMRLFVDRSYLDDAIERLFGG